MKRKLALPVFLLAAVLCAVWSFIEAKQPTPASLRKQLIDALDSVDAVSFQPDRLDSNHAEGPVTDAKYVEEICALLRQLEPADDVVWPAEEEQYLFSKASFVLLSGHGSEELTTADGTAETPRCYILTDRGNDRTLLFLYITEAEAMKIRISGSSARCRSPVLTIPSRWIRNCRAAPAPRSSC